MCHFPKTAEMLWSQEGSWQFSPVLVTLISAIPCPRAGIPVAQAWMQSGAASRAGHKRHHCLLPNAAGCRRSSHCPLTALHCLVQALPPAGVPGAAKGSLKELLGSAAQAKAWGSGSLCVVTPPNWAPACGTCGYQQSPVKQQRLQKVREAGVRLGGVLVQLLGRGDVGQRLAGEQEPRRMSRSQERGEEKRQWSENSPSLGWCRASWKKVSKYLLGMTSCFGAGVSVENSWFVLFSNKSVIKMAQDVWI